MLKLAFLLLSSSAAFATSLPRSTTDLNIQKIGTFNHTLTWVPCANQTLTPTSLGYSCGNFTIPLDYHNLTAGSGHLSVIKVNATGERKGTLLTNPGGPGGQGTLYLTDMPTVKMYQHLTGGIFDIVSWDPRGTGAVTIPTGIDCFDTPDDYAQFWNGTYQITGGPEFIGNFTRKVDVDAFYAHLPKQDEAWKNIPEICFRKHGESLRYIGTAAGARDMLAMTEHFDGKNAKVNYYGISYGSSLGNVFANMFPDRVGRFVIDGIVDPQFSFSQPVYRYYPDLTTDSDKVLHAFLSLCADAGSAGCALAPKNESIGQLEHNFQQILNASLVYNQHIDANISSALVRSVAFAGLYEPFGWQTLASVLQTSYLQILSAIESGKALPAELVPSVLPYALNAISCGDAFDDFDITSKQEFDSIVEDAKVGNTSAFFAPRMPAGYGCQHWPFRAVERYQGPFNKNLSNPILVIGNLADPITPYRHAVKIANAFGDSAFLIKHNGHGHTSTLSEPSDCTTNTVTAYLANNTLPKHRKTICDINPINLFPATNASAPTASSITSNQTPPLFR